MSERDGGGKADMTPLPGKANNAAREIKRIWKRTLHYTSACWKRFQREYLPSLRQWRTKDGDGDSRCPRTNEVVLVEHAPHPRLRWPMAKVIRVYPHHADILLRGRITSRAIKCLYPLEAADDAEQLGERPAFRNQPDVSSESVKVSDVPYVGARDVSPAVAERLQPVLRMTRAGRTVRPPNRLGL